tara:strand:- start:4759 stop:5208 length:450 start_codon:yes stop_codon:yes gene_type:complete
MTDTFPPSKQADGEPFKYQDDKLLAAYNDWISNDIANASERAIDIFKFCFGVSSTFLLVTITLYKIEGSSINLILFFMVGFYIASMWVIIHAILHEPSKDLDDISLEYIKFHSFFRETVYKWFVLLLISIGLTFWGLLGMHENIDLCFL